MWKREAIISLLCGLAELSGLCDEVRGSDIQRELLAELLLLHVERSRSRRPLIRRISRAHPTGEGPMGWAGNVLEGSRMSSVLKVPRGESGECC